MKRTITDGVIISRATDFVWVVAMVLFRQGAAHKGWGGRNQSTGGGARPGLPGKDGHRQRIAENRVSR
ncbi:hypothetical protein Sa4125_28380 [Aureimonas sp. SA4125]|nr:hypothetical protein Sa4125_28380 [Aureimonas sp. SA4125]